VQPTITYVPSQRAGQSASVAAADVWGALVLGGLLLAALLWRRTHQRRAIAAREAEATGHALRPGVSVISGVVATEDDSDGWAVSIEIDQEAREWKAKQNWHVTWQEVARRTEVRPFYIVRPGGDRVRVEPNTNVFLIDQLDGEVREPSAARRTRTARLTPGESVYASGVLTRARDPQTGGYRDGEGWVLRPQPGAKMLISTEPQSKRHERRARFHRGWIIALGICIALVHGGLFATFHLLELGGQVVTAQVTNTSTFQVWVKPRSSRGYWRTHYVVEAEYPDDHGQLHAVRDETNWAFYNSLRRVDAQTVPFRVLPSLRLAQIGPVATLDVWKIAVAMVIYFLLLLLYPLTSVRSRPWYDKRRVVETVKGRL